MRYFSPQYTPEQIDVLTINRAEGENIGFSDRYTRVLEGWLRYDKRYAQDKQKVTTRSAVLELSQTDTPYVFTSRFMSLAFKSWRRDDSHGISELYVALLDVGSGTDLDASKVTVSMIKIPPNLGPDDYPYTKEHKPFAEHFTERDVSFAQRAIARQVGVGIESFELSSTSS